MPAPEKRGSFWPTQQSIHAIDGGDAGLDEVAWINAGGRVDRLTIDIGILVGQRLRAAIQRAAQAVENTPQHLFRYRDCQRAAQEAHVCSVNRKPGGAGKNFHHRHAFAHFQHTSQAHLPV